MTQAALDEALDVMREVMKSADHERGWKAILLAYVRMQRFIDRYQATEGRMTGMLDYEQMREGALAQRDGIAIDACPYPDEPFSFYQIMRLAWQFGWRQEDLAHQMDVKMLARNPCGQ